MARSRKRKKKNWWEALPGINLTFDQWLDILGYALLTIAGLTLLSFLSANRGVILGKWLEWLTLRFGWGTYPLPLLLGAFGLWLILRDFGDQLPVTPLQGVGALLGYLALLVTLHFIAALFQFGGDIQAAAEAGVGGGSLGAMLTRPLLKGLGNAGLVVALLTIWLIVLALTFEVTVEDGLRAIHYVQEQLFPGQAAPLPTDAPAHEQSLDQLLSQHETPTAPAGVPAPSSAAPVQPRLIGDVRQFHLPILDEILDPGNDHDVSAAILREQARIIEKTLESLGAPVRVREINQGPTVTQYGIEPLVINRGTSKERKVKVSNITGRADDLALALEAKTVRVETPIPGKQLIGIEVPNPETSLVALRDLIESKAYQKIESRLRLGLGQDVSGHPVVADLAAMPHMLIAGATGSGKSVCLNSIIAALLLQNTPDTLRFLMVDPKRVELTGYNGVPHLLSEVVVDMERVTKVLHWVLGEMDGRYRRFSEARATNIRDYNERVAPSLGEKQLPYIVVVVDELADLMMVAPQEVERSICRIAQMARATGIHMLIATQRPSVDVVTGLIKANFPARIAFNVASSVDSRVILDMSGAEHLLGRGDMLFQSPESPAPMRLQGTFVSDEELRRLVRYWREQARPEAIETGKAVQQPLWEDLRQKEGAVEYEDELLPDVVDLLLHEGRASVSLMQRKLRIGYTRAARIMDILEEHGVVGPQPSGGKAREVFPEAARLLLQPPEEEESTDW
jgi:S-DNA-T family DNA segregation ATPase FtsK/SpoIIIE